MLEKGKNLVCDSEGRGFEPHHPPSRKAVQQRLSKETEELKIIRKPETFPITFPKLNLK